MRLADRITTDAYKVLPHAEQQAEVQHTSRVLQRFNLNPHASEEEVKKALRDDPDALPWITSELNDASKDMRKLKRELAANHERARDALGQLLSLVPIVSCQNVYQWMRDTRDTTDIYNMACLAPKWEAFWVEWAQSNGQSIGIMATIDTTAPEQLFPRGQIRTSPEERKLVGEVLSMNTDDDNGLVAYEHYWTSDNLPDVAAWDAVEWVWRASVYAETDRSIFGPIATYLLAINPHGRCLDATWAIHAPVDDYDGFVEDLGNILRVWGQTLSFLNCRNVQTVYRTPSPGEQKKHRKKRKGAHPLLSYNLIQIQPTGKAVVNRSTGDGDDERAYHIAGGSIAHYGNCCPGPTGHSPKGLLFGKHQGIYYRPPHVKGNPRHGIVATDFEIQTPR